MTDFTFDAVPNYPLDIEPTRIIEFSADVPESVEFDPGAQEVAVYGYSPRIGENGNWFAYDAFNGWYDTGTPAQGEQGEPGEPVYVDHVDESTEDGGTNTVYFSDESELHVKNGHRGNDGYTPQKGIDYFDGEPGNDGVSPEIIVTPIDNGHRVTVTDKYGTTSFDVMNGEGAVASVNGKTGTVVLNADDVGAYSKTEVDDKLDSKMERFVMRLVKNADNTYKITSLDDADMDFNEVYTVTRNLSEYVVIIYGNSKLRPQYVSTNEMSFIGLDRSTETKVLRIIYTPARLSYETFRIAEYTDIPAIANWAKQPNKPAYTASEISATNGSTVQAVLNAVYPVGAIYMSTVDVSPAGVFGGTWEKIKDRFLLAAGDSYAAGDTGGEASHLLSELEMPSHIHDKAFTWDGGGDHDEWAWTIPMAGRGGWSYGSWPEFATGGSQPHNNMPPYLTVYIWKRIA